MAEHTQSFNRPASSDTFVQGNGLVSVTTTSAVIAAANPDRVAFVATNLNASNQVWLGLGETAVVSQGIRLNGATAGTVDGSNQHRIDYFNGAIHAVATGTRSVAFVEI